jgi:Ca2+/H+ antiporter, TMEM165/GDT1 family
MRSAWAGGLHLRSRTDETRGAGVEVNTIVQGALIHDGYERPCHATPGFRGTQTQGFWMEAFLVSTGVVALAELGDKTQLLALVLAARFRAPVAVIAGIATAVLMNHTLAGVAGTLLATVLAPQLLRWLLVASFLATAVWMLIPDQEPAAGAHPARFGAYGTTAVTFFLVEMGDKTQVATLALAARYRTLIAVVAGTALGMLIADVPAVLLGRVVAERIPVRLLHRIGAVVCLALAVLALL